MKEITRARSEGRRLVIKYNEFGQPIGQNVTKLKSFIGTTVRFHVLITYFDWPMVPKEINDKIYELIEVEFVVDPRSKKSLIQNAGVCFRQFKYRLTTTYVLPFKDSVEKLKFSLNEYSFIEQEHWNEFVASRLKEDFRKKSEEVKEKWKQHKYNHRASRKRYANLIEELVDSLSVDSIKGHNQVSGKGFPTTGPRIEAGNVEIHRGLYTPMPERSMYCSYVNGLCCELELYVDGLKSLKVRFVVVYCLDIGYGVMPWKDYESDSDLTG
ncbi:uncharacterized protein E5676_scaffold862G00180 [Cucumis melo var. makuwa]|uniref:Uncharacterized protein n=1 Tax=Cucumis melo var. makuwa TaxID=1194695 RepID=A0A5D3DPX5_CUCMM|nr:uncharacterized protein E6C27_scaffold285G00450 [Cucumis melo var. makuwa]TYK25726.1 uncharacterized protein E5676_scaffold862G00180 [Cucumis melo var. makuwa]